MVTRMVTRDCAACTRPAGASYVLCFSCVDRLADGLHAVPGLLDDLDTTYARLDRISVTSGRGGDTGLPVKLTAADAREHLGDIITYWTYAAIKGRETPWNAPNTLAELAIWLSRRLDWLRALESAGDAYSQLHRAVSTAWRVIDRPTHRCSFWVGLCPEIAADGVHYCSGDVWAYVPLRIGVDPAVLRCRNPECKGYHEPWAVPSWRKIGHRIAQRRRRTKVVVSG